MTGVLNLLLKSERAVAAVAWPARANAQDAYSAGAAQAGIPKAVAATGGRLSDAGEIVITANKREENLNRLGLSVTAISDNTLADRHITTTNRPFVIPGHSVFVARLGYGLPGVSAGDAVGQEHLQQILLHNANHFLASTVLFAFLPTTHGATLSFKN